VDPKTVRKPGSSAELPARPVERWLTPARKFLHVESASGVVLLTCTVVALALANSPLAGQFAALWHTHVALALGPMELSGDLGHLVINDGLMAIFFFIVGLEIKREVISGELREPRKALLPVVAALGGMVVPALIYTALQWGQPGQRGWAIPMATDIAFVVGFLALFGPRVPFGLKILLLSLAIVDDLGAVLIIATVFTGSLAWDWLAVAAGLLTLTYGMNRAGVRSVGVYLIVGVGVWLAVYKSGVHPTVAGVVLGFMTPSRPWLETGRFRAVVGRLRETLNDPSTPDGRRAAALDEVQFAARESLSPLHRLETALHPWVAFGIMPLFALANAGVPVQVSALGDPVALAVAAGLALGKPLGVLLFCFVAVKLKLTKLPDGVGWGLMTGGACLAGIGFTMALFVNGLAFPGDQFAGMATAGKVGTLLGSVVSATLGAVILMVAVAAKRKASVPA
jgi:NhaA family Na+:H+ antiporter